MLRKVIICFTAAVFLLNIMAISVLSAPAVGEPVYDVETVADIMANTNVFELQAKSYVLMDAETGQILLENRSHERLPIASITKIMSMLLVMEAIDSGKINMDDIVTASEYAASMGGSQAYIEPGEQYTVRDALKAVATHSSNDVTVSLAELVAGSEQVFVVLMNEKAKELGMNNTNFLDCTGLTDEGHYSTAYDVALMSRELIVKHPKILEFTSIWMDTFRNGEFQLVNTNKLVHFYEGCDGLKTGFTRAAGHCLSATAKRNDMRLISVVLGEPDSNTRFAETRKLLDYGFANYESKQVNKKGEVVNEIEVKRALIPKIKALYGDDVKLLFARSDKGKVVREVRLKSFLTAPVAKGEKVGEVVYKIGEKEIAKVDLVSDRDVEKASFGKLFINMLSSWFSLGRS
ncbi:MAG TPA: D-alanyl-D-alanine carboxypeptidase [Hungateiclostridium thermocellum]|uniref:serine-type D-Ala-D-Ala carboxypeptidase n=1 Tax=Acetivibrio thermocellus (strain ATCC 27405 / DSM 1237 / JCM 9322 / NBRC 103400 / NCIMB 10682 / NRRL B-4536 / VPI 7372) TaxID=203119 RepID=A3DD85_ACET2|nr:D-alanyl-D-alanine carboxypeptidase family protein [Acetivibrio thermocellus]ABN51914.1 Serine-type D-Ala-D-Ala carboxypeptidase [Acetivibrio thermocellus ATCC 27405]HBW27614.1 D-alanyl-D-alanine carboxypeptidase [Acetivibrio thermocellus]